MMNAKNFVVQPERPHLWNLVSEALALCYRAAPGYEVRISECAAMIFSGEPVADLNYIVIVRDKKADAHLRELVQASQERLLPTTVLLVNPVSEQLSSTALTLELISAGRLPLMIYRPDATSTASRQYRYERIENTERLHSANQVAAGAFGVEFTNLNRAFGPAILDAPGLDIFVARQNETVLASVQTTRAGATVGIWAMATAPQHQRQGVGRALLDFVLAYHHDRGVELFYLLASEAGEPLYTQTGFCTVDEAEVWLVDTKEK